MTRGKSSAQEAEILSTSTISCPVNEYVAAARLGDFRFQFLAARAVRDFSLMIKEVGNHAVQRNHSASKIAAQVQDESFVFAGIIENPVHFVVLQEEFRHLPDHHVACVHPALANDMIGTLFLPHQVPEITSSVLSGQVQHFLQLAHFGVNR
jgi:hypothetical protein